MRQSSFCGTESLKFFTILVILRLFLSAHCSNTNTRGKLAFFKGTSADDKNMKFCVISSHFLISL